MDDLAPEEYAIAEQLELYKRKLQQRALLNAEGECDPQTPAESAKQSKIKKKTHIHKEIERINIESA